MDNNHVRIHKDESELSKTLDEERLLKTSSLSRSPDGASGSTYASLTCPVVGGGGVSGSGGVVYDKSSMYSTDFDSAGGSYSVIGQLRELLQASAADSNDTWWSVLKKSVSVIANTLLATVFLGLLLVLPFGMVSIGFKYLNECPIQPKIPIYLLVGGCFGLLKLLSLLFYQIRTRRYERLDDVTDYTYDDDDDDDVTPGLRSGHVSNGLSSSRFTDVLLSCFLFVWFVCGQCWVFAVWAPNYRQTIQQPNAWCHKTVYVFSVVQIVVCYVLIGLIGLLSAILIVCQRIYASRS